MAKDLRNKENLEKIPKNIPGWYRWFAPKKALEKLLNSEYLDKKYLDILLPELKYTKINGELYYYIYVGISKSIGKRLNWHVNQHTDISVKNGFLSTLRKSISSLIAKNQFEKEETDKLMNMLIIEYYTLDNEKEAVNKEFSEIMEHPLPLNIKGNKKEILKEYKKQLKLIRKNSKK